MIFFSQSQLLFAKTNEHRTTSRKALYFCLYNIDRRRINETPKKAAVLRWTNNFLESDTVVDKDRNGRPKCATTEEKSNNMNDYIEQNPDKSLGHQCQNLNISKTSLY